MRRGRKPLLVGLGIVAAALTMNAAIGFAQTGSPFARQAWTLGPAVVRAEIVVKNAGGVHAYRVDRGRFLSVGQQSVVIRERDGLRVAIPVGGATRVVVDGLASSLNAIPRNARVEALRDGDGPATLITATSPR